jgi:hypothetical protein
MRWVWIVAATWVVLAVPLGLLLGRWLRSLGHAEPGRADSGPLGRTPPARRRGRGPYSLQALLPGVHASGPRRQPPDPVTGPTTNPRLAALSHRPRRSNPGNSAHDGGPTDPRGG